MSTSISSDIVKRPEVIYTLRKHVKLLDSNVELFERKVWDDLVYDHALSFDADTEILCTIELYQSVWEVNKDCIIEECGIDCFEEWFYMITSNFSYEFMTSPPEEGDCLDVFYLFFFDVFTMLGLPELAEDCKQKYEEL